MSGKNEKKSGDWGTLRKEESPKTFVKTTECD